MHGAASVAAPVPGPQLLPPHPAQRTHSPAVPLPGFPKPPPAGPRSRPLPAVPGPAPAGGRRPRGRHKRRFSRHPNKAHPSAAGSGRARRLGMCTALHVGRAALLPSAEFIMCSAFPTTLRQDPNQVWCRRTGKQCKTVVKCFIHSARTTEKEYLHLV